MNTLVAILAGLGGLSFVGTAINAYAQRRKIKAEEHKTGVDATAILTETATELLVPLRAELRETRKEFADTRAELVETRAEVSALRGQLTVVEGLLRTNGIPIPEFVWPPVVGRLPG